jgi:hypothetical protein
VELLPSSQRPDAGRPVAWPRSITTASGEVIDENGAFTTPVTQHDGFKQGVSFAHISHLYVAARVHAYLLAREHVTIVLSQRGWVPTPVHGDWHRQFTNTSIHDWMNDAHQALPPELSNTLKETTTQIWVHPPAGESDEFGAPGIMVFGVPSKRKPGGDTSGTEHAIDLVVSSTRYGVARQGVHPTHGIRWRLPLPLNTIAQEIETHCTELEQDVETWVATGALVDPDFAGYVKRYKTQQAQTLCANTFIQTMGEDRLDAWIDGFSFPSHKLRIIKVLTNDVSYQQVVHLSFSTISSSLPPYGVYGFTVVADAALTTTEFQNTLKTHIRQTSSIVSPTRVLFGTLNDFPAAVVVPDEAPWRDHLFALETAATDAFFSHNTKQFNLHHTHTLLLNAQESEQAS